MSIREEKILAEIIAQDEEYGGSGGSGLLWRFLFIREDELGITRRFKESIVDGFHGIPDGKSNPSAYAIGSAARTALGYDVSLW